MNRYFYTLYLPFLVILVVGLATVTPSVWLILVFWFLHAFLGLGIGYHRLFSHAQYQTYYPVRLCLALLGTLAAYAPIALWTASHISHHKHLNTDKDPTSSSKNFFDIVFLWNLKQSFFNTLDFKNTFVLSIMRDKNTAFLNKYFTTLNSLYLIVLTIISPEVAVAYLCAVFIEILRVGFFVHYLPHRNATTRNIRLWPFTAGFSYHKEHHANPRATKESTRRFDFNLEHYIIKLIQI